MLGDKDSSNGSSDEAELRNGDYGAQRTSSICWRGAKPSQFRNRDMCQVDGKTIFLFFRANDWIRSSNHVPNGNFRKVPRNAALNTAQ
jgi:hypothetical protein